MSFDSVQSLESQSWFQSPDEDSVVSRARDLGMRDGLELSFSPLTRIPWISSRAVSDDGQLKQHHQTAFQSPDEDSVDF